MGINIADNFQYLSQKPLDGRTKYDTTAAMKAVPDSSMYDGCMAYCSGTDKTYQWKSSNSVDATLGRWREFATGGTDSNAYHTSDATGSAIVDDDYFPFYDTSVSTKKKSTWANLKSLLKTYFDTLYNKYTLPTATSSVLGGVKIGENMLIEDGVINPSYLVVANKFNKSDIYSTTEKVVGCWTDGRPVYMKVFTGTLYATTEQGTTEVQTNVAIGVNVSSYLDLDVAFINTAGATVPIPCYIHVNNIKPNIRYIANDNSATTNKNTIVIYNAWAITNLTYRIIARYTKTTDAANSFNYADENDYSTSEKIVGTWVDGSNLYQKNVTVTLPTCSTDGQTATSDVTLSSLGISGVKVVTKCDGYVVNDTIFRRINSTFYTGTVIRELSVVPSKTSLQLRNGTAALSGKTAYVTLQYTK